MGKGGGGKKEGQANNLNRRGAFTGVAVMMPRGDDDNRGCDVLIYEGTLFFLDFLMFRYLRGRNGVIVSYSYLDILPNTLGSATQQSSNLRSKVHLFCGEREGRRALTFSCVHQIRTFFVFFRVFFLCVSVFSMIVMMQSVL